MAGLFFVTSLEKISGQPPATKIYVNLGKTLKE